MPALDSVDDAPGSSPSLLAETSLLAAAAERSEPALAGAEVKADGNRGEKRKGARGAAGAGGDGRQLRAKKRPADHSCAAVRGGASGQVPSLPVGAAYAAPLGNDDAALSGPALPRALAEYANIVRKLQAGMGAGMGEGWTVGGSAAGAGTGSLSTTLKGHGGPDALRVAANRRPMPSNTSLLTESGARVEDGGAFVPRTSGAHLMSMSQVRNVFCSDTCAGQDLVEVQDLV